MKTKLTLFASALLLIAGGGGIPALAAEPAGKPPAGGDTAVKPYPKKTCIVSGNKLGSMGDPVTLVHKGQEVKFCCRPCVKKFNANPDKYLSKLR